MFFRQLIFFAIVMAVGGAAGFALVVFLARKFPQGLLMIGAMAVGVIIVWGTPEEDRW